MKPIKLNRSQFEVLRFVMYDDDLPSPPNESRGFIPRHIKAIQQLTDMKIIREGRHSFIFIAKTPFTYIYNTNEYTVI